MTRTSFHGVVLLGMLVVCPSLRAQFQFTAGGKQVQIHAFISQGFAYSNRNNVLTMNTSGGAFDFTDAGLNVSIRISDRLRVRAQVYDRNIGWLGEWKLNLDYALVDYLVNDRLGFRVGKVKTVIGLYNDTQDMESVHTWALMPQAVYPTDLRTTNLAHIGADIYGSIPLRGAGRLAYIAYAGLKSDDHRSGWYYSNVDIGWPVKRIAGRTAGGDLRWVLPVGLTLGGSFSEQRDHWDGWLSGYNYEPYIYWTPGKWYGAIYGDFQTGNWRFSAEFIRNHEDGAQAWSPSLGRFNYPYGYRGWYVSAAYRVNKYLEIGGYNSQYQYLGIPAHDQIFDRVAAARVDLTSYWRVKLEGHFMTGTGGAVQGAAHGLYVFDNPTLYPTTNMLVLRTGFSF